MHSLAAATLSEGLTARTSLFLDLCHSSVVKVQPTPNRPGAIGAERAVWAVRRGPSNGPATGPKWAGSTVRASENARLQQGDRERAGDPRLECELHGARRAERPGEHRVDDDADHRGDDELRKAQPDLDEELLHRSPYLARSPIARRPWSARMRVTSSAYSRS